jgi:eukaryotic-like serine/threonine-protein kinase
MSLAPGTGLGAYEIIAALGAGGMGEVYRARDTRLNREVALKILPIWGIDDQDFRARCKREAQALAALNSPHIAAIHDVIDFDGHQAIIMELVLGTTLLDVIARGPVPVRLAIGYAIDISEALRVAHGASIVHRDLKPANVVVTESGFAKVLDFGIAKLGVDEATATDRGTMTAVTQDHAVLGTIGYMSPEQAEGQPLDGRSDIFCLEHFQPASLAGCGGSGGRTRH